MVLNPITGVLTNVALPVSEDIFCSGLSILENGNVLVTGGHVEGTTCRSDGAESDYRRSDQCRVAGLGRHLLFRFVDSGKRQCAGDRWKRGGHNLQIGWC